MRHPLPLTASCTPPKFRKGSQTSASPCSKLALAVSESSLKILKSFADYCLLARCLRGYFPFSPYRRSLSAPIVIGLHFPHPFSCVNLVLREAQSQYQLCRRMYYDVRLHLPSTIMPRSSTTPKAPADSPHIFTWTIPTSYFHSPNLNTSSNHQRAIIDLISFIGSRVTTATLWLRHLWRLVSGETAFPGPGITRQFSLLAPNSDFHLDHSTAECSGNLSQHVQTLHHSSIQNIHARHKITPSSTPWLWYVVMQYFILIPRFPAFLSRVPFWKRIGIWLPFKYPMSRPGSQGSTRRSSPI